VNGKALEFHGVTLRYEGSAVPVASDVTFSLDGGERVALVGLNGSGKTTLLSAAVGLVPHTGEIRVAGAPVTRKTIARIREQVGFVFNVPEDQLLFPGVLDDVLFGLLRRGVPRKEAVQRARQALGALGIEHLADAPVHRLSHGQKQRVALAGALVTRPALLLLDEPTAGLDPPAKRLLSEHLRDWDAAMLIATHDLDFAARLCKRYLLLEQGHLVLDTGDPAELRRRWDIPLAGK